MLHTSRIHLFFILFLLTILSSCSDSPTSDNSSDTDTTAPVITLLGDNPLDITLGDTYTDPGVTASDNIDGVITNRTIVAGDTVNTSLTGTYVLTYNISDAAGNPAAQITRTVIVRVSLPTVNAYYPDNGADWNDYLENNGTSRYSATDTACTTLQTGYANCIHGGEMRAVSVPGITSCTNLTATDALDAFNWTCDASSNSVRMVSTGLKANKNLSDLIEFNTVNWLNNSVTVSGTGDGLPFTTLAKIWWSNPVIEDADGGSLTNSSTVYLITGNTTATYTIEANKISLLIQPGTTLAGPATGGDVISAESRNFLWIEGAIDAADDRSGIFLNNVGYSVIRDATVLNNIDAVIYNYGIYLYESSSNFVSNSTLTKNYFGIYVLNSRGNLLSNITAENNTHTGICLEKKSGGIYFITTSDNILSNITALNNGYYGVYLRTATDNTLSNIQASNNGFHGIYLYTVANNNTLSNITASNNNSVGVYLSISSFNSLANINTFNNAYDGVYLSRSSNNTLSNITASSNVNAGIEVYDYSLNNTLGNITVTNNAESGIHIISSSSYNLLLNIAASNNKNGIYLQSTVYNSVLNIAASDNNIGINLEGTPQYFTGLLKVGNNLINDCYVTAKNNPGLIDTTCTDSGNDGSNTYTDQLSDAILTRTTLPELTLATSFVAKITTDDAINISDTNGSMNYDTNIDWNTFENRYRNWGIDNSTFPNTDQRGQWTTGTGRIWDWSLSSEELVIRNVLSDPDDTDTIPDGNDTIVHTWDDSSTSTFLRNATEIIGDGMGNDNLMCETGETCLFTPNIGSYQGHGSLQSAGTFIDGDITDVILLKYSNNGY